MLRIEAEQGMEDGPGWCRLRIHGLERHAGTVELLFRRPGASRIYLGRSDWEESETWLELPVAAEGAALVARLGPPQTLRLGKIATVEVRARVPGGADQRTRLAWPRIVLPAENDVQTVDGPWGELPAPLARASELEIKAAPSAPPKPAVAKASSPTAPRLDPPRRAVPPEPHPASVAGVGAAVTLLLIILVLFSLFMLWRSGAEHQATAVPPPTRAFTEESVRAFLAADPDGPGATAEASLYQAAGHPDLALLIYRHAARRGEPKAALAIGRMYDPEGFDPTRSAFRAPDSDQAARFYEQAAESGDAEAQLRLGRLLLSGRTSGEADAERGALWLRRAAEQGDAQARTALEKLEKRVP